MTPPNSVVRTTLRAVVSGISEAISRGLDTALSLVSNLANHFLIHCLELLSALANYIAIFFFCIVLLAIATNMLERGAEAGRAFITLIDRALELGREMGQRMLARFLKMMSRKLRHWAQSLTPTAGNVSATKKRMPHPTQKGD